MTRTQSPTTRFALTATALALFVTSASAQTGGSQAEQRHRQELKELREEYDERLRSLEERADAAEAKQDAQRRGISELGQTTIFDNIFNPAISLSADFALPWSDKRDSVETLNRLSLRSLELGVVGRVDPYLSYQAYIHLDEDEIEIEEAFGLVDNWLPDTFMLKFGRFNTDFGKISPIHDHDLTFLDKPQVLQEDLGGSLRGTGIELHHWTPLGDSHLVRWSASITNELDGDSHASFGPAAGHEHDEEEVKPFGERELDNFAFQGRASALLETGEARTLQLGTSAAWSPQERSFRDENGTVVRADLERLLLGGDVTFKTADQASGSGTTVAGEVLFSKRDFVTNATGIRNVSSLGFYAYAERAFNRNWSLGVSGGRFAHAEDDRMKSWDVGTYLNWHVNEFNRIRCEARHFDDPGEDFWGVTLQWTIILGSHGHGIDW